MKVKALASLSTPIGWKESGDEYTVNVAEADALVERGLVELVGAESGQAADPAPAKTSKAAKSQS